MYKYDTISNIIPNQCMAIESPRNRDLQVIIRGFVVKEEEHSSSSLRAGRSWWGNAHHVWDEWHTIGRTVLHDKEQIKYYCVSVFMRVWLVLGFPEHSELSLVLSEHMTQIFHTVLEKVTQGLCIVLLGEKINVFWKKNATWT